MVPRSAIKSFDIDALLPPPAALKAKGEDPKLGGILTFGANGFFGMCPVDALSAEEGGMIGWTSTYETPERERKAWKEIPRAEILEELKRRYGKW